MTVGMSNGGRVNAAPRIAALFAFGLVCTCTRAFGEPPVPTAADLEFFEKSIRPILVNRCYECHGPAEQKSKLRLDHISSALLGGERGPALVPGNPASSSLVKAIEYMDSKLQMPPKKMLEDEEIDLLIDWVRRGAPWPDEPVPAPSIAAGGGFDLEKRKAEHWAWQPVRAQKPPPVQQTDWPLTPADNFVLARLEQEGLRPAAEADRRTLVRRVYFDLIGLPPTPEQIESFVNDSDPKAYEKLVDRLLSDPHYGERWGRHWLDLVRFAESYGHEGDYVIREAWRYRDYVIRAMNDDLPYDRLVREHIAGDLLPDPRVNPTDGTNESQLATGWWYMHQATHAPVDVIKDEADRIDNQIDVLGKAFLGMTVACARCHDHKFDAISAKDYYSLGAFMRASRQAWAYLDPHGQIGAAAQALDDIHADGTRDLAKTLGASAKDASREVKKYLLAAREVMYGEPSPRDARFAGQTEVFADFEGDNFDDWKTDGDAFGEGPAAGTLENQQTVSGFEGDRLANSFHNGDKPVGTLFSPEFTIEHPYIHFLVGGGREDDKTAVTLEVGGEVVRRAAGRNDERLRWTTWDVRDLKGKTTARFVVLDRNRGGWGHIQADQFLFSDEPVPMTLNRSVSAVAKEATLDADRLGAWLQILATGNADAPEHPLFAWSRLANAERTAFDEKRAAAQQEMAAPAPQDQTVVYETFDDPGLNGWYPSGEAFGDGVSQTGSWQPGNAFVERGAAHSGLRAPQLQGTLRSPTFKLNHESIHFRMKGHGGQVRLIVGRYMLREANPLLFENTWKDANSDDYIWVNMTGGLGKWQGDEAYIEIVDDGEGWIAVDEIRFSHGPPSPEGASDEMRDLLAAHDVTSAERLADAYADWTEAALSSWGKQGLDAGDAEWLELLSRNGLIDLSGYDKSMGALDGRVAAAVKDLPAPVRAPSIVEGSVEPAIVFIRGNHTDPGEPVDRRFLEALDGTAPLVESADESGRMELADRLVADDNPLFARVMANRIWHHLFGRGIVASTDNFGVLGELPSHPELLDYLATQFRDGGYSIKETIRTLVTSRTYRMSSAMSDRTSEDKDPNNVLLHRASVRRLESEAIRDSVLAAAGTLDPTMYGESVKAYLSPYNSNHRRPSVSGPLDGGRRRSIYMEVRRNFLSDMLLAFDLPLPDSTVGKRTVSNVPAQSLIFMNDPFIAEQAKAWGARMAQDERSFDAKVSAMCERAWGRPAADAELASMRGFVDRQRAAYDLAADAAQTDPRIWADIAQVLFMTKSFIFIA